MERRKTVKSSLKVLEDKRIATALLAPQPLTAQQFARLAAQWKTGRGPASSRSEMVMHPAYQQIIGTGQSAIRFCYANWSNPPIIGFGP
jgi:hypothetical protein